MEDMSRRRLGQMVGKLKLVFLLNFLIQDKALFAKCVPDSETRGKLFKLFFRIFKLEEVELHTLEEKTLRIFQLLSDPALGKLATVVQDHSLYKVPVSKMLSSDPSDDSPELELK